MNLKAFPGGLNRRDFVKRGSAAVVGGLVASQLPLSASAYVRGDDTIKIGVIGCGGRGTGAAVQALSTKQNVKLVAMADAFEDRVEESYNNITAADFEDWSGGGTGSIQDRIDVPKERRFSGFDAYKQVIPLVDVIILATPPGFRPMHFKAAVDAGKHVFMEKPVATDAPGVRSVLETAELAKQKQLNVVVGLQRHYQTVYREWINRIHDGTIGDITTSRVYWNGAGVWVRERKPGMTEMEYQMRNWYYFNWLCGDHIVEQHIHNIDVSNWAKGAYPINAQGMGGREIRTGKEHGEIFDHHFVEFEYADGSRMFSQCRHQRGCWNKISEAFHGTMGSAPEPGVLLDQHGHEIFKHRDKDDPNPYQVEHDELFAAVANGEYKYADAENGAMATMSAILGRMATYSGKMVTMEEALASELALVPSTFAWDANPPIMPGPDGYYPTPKPGETVVV
ncbi:MAG: Gfo/Idh/MocA family oxidoreductase [Rhodothermales bacterium]